MSLSSDEAAALAARHRAANWRTWTGREACPVGPFVRVAILQRDGRVLRGQAGDWCWTYPQGPDCGEEPDEIVAYRLVDEPVAAGFAEVA